MEIKLKNSISHLLGTLEYRTPDTFRQAAFVCVRVQAENQTRT